MYEMSDGLKRIYLYYLLLLTTFYSMHSLLQNKFIESVITTQRCTGCSRDNDQNKTNNKCLQLGICDFFIRLSILLPFHDPSIFQEIVFFMKNVATWRSHIFFKHLVSNAKIYTRNYQKWKNKHYRF